MTFINKILRQLAAFGWGFVLALLLFSWCNDKGKAPQSPVILRDTVYLKRLVRDTVITLRERLLGWVKVVPETVVVSPETVLIETVWAEHPWSVVWAKGEEGRLSLVALREDSFGRALLRDYTFSVGDQWIVAAGDTGLTLKTRWRVRVRPWVGVEFWGGWSPVVGLRLSYRDWELAGWLSGKPGFWVSKTF